MLKKNYPLKLNGQKTAKSHSIRHNNAIQKNRKFKNAIYSPLFTLPGDSMNNHYSAGLKNYKSTNKTISVNSLPKLDKIINNQNKGQFELFVRNKTSYFKNSDLKQDNSNDELFLEIELLWNELGITDEYQDQFELYLGSIEYPDNQNIFLLNEKSNLIKIKEALLKLSKEKKIRIKNIEQLKKYNNIMKENYIGENRINKELIKDIIECIKSIRINSVNVVNSLIKAREAMTCYSLEDKIDFERINTNYFFDNNYLLKMNSELSFLKYSEIKKIFEKNNREENIDTFLTLFTKIKINENEMISTSISKELLTAIEKCRYYIMQDNFLNNIRIKRILKVNNKKNNGLKMKNKNKGNSLLTLSNVGFKDLSNNFMDVKLFKLKTQLGKDYNNIFLNSNKQNSNINLNMNNNKRYIFLKNQMRMYKGNNIVIERNDSPLKIKEDVNKNKNKENENNKYYDFNDNINEDSGLNIDKENNLTKNKKGIKYNEEEIYLGENDKNDLNLKNENDNKSDKNIENKSDKNIENEQNLNNKEKEKDDEDNIVDVDYLDYIKGK